MTVIETLETYPLFDSAIVRHGFVPYHRDYELIFDALDASRYRCLFTHCVAAEFETRIADAVWPMSWDDELTDMTQWARSGEPPGYVWGTNWAEAYPGLEYIADSQAAQSWSARLGHEMHEVKIETNVYELRLVFHSVRVTRLENGPDSDPRLFNSPSA